MTDGKEYILQLFQQHYRPMFRLAVMLLHDEAESKDVVHDVFAKLLSSPQLLRQKQGRDDTPQETGTVRFSVAEGSLGHPSAGNQLGLIGDMRCPAHVIHFGPHGYRVTFFVAYRDIHSETVVMQSATKGRITDIEIFGRVFFVVAFALYV